MGLSSQDLVKVKAVFDKYGVPEKIWQPIMQTESSGNPFSTAVTSTEYSKGLFQINVKAHPQYATTDLYNPVTNAEIAAKTFIAPAYNYAKTVTDDVKAQALIVYSGLKNPGDPSQGYVPEGGIRPKWTSETASRFLNNFDAFVPTSSTGKKNPADAKMFQDYILDKDQKTRIYNNPDEWNLTGNIFDPKSLTDKLPPFDYTGAPALAFSQTAVKIIAIIGLVIIIVVATFTLFKDTTLVKTVKRGVAAYATGGVTEIAK